LSGRNQRPLVNINCAALPANLIESELFGREKGAFTGAQTRQIGRFELADRGTIFLDEIGELPIDLQAKLLRVLEDGEFERLGSPHTIKVNARIIASTNRDLEEEIKNGRFRKDLYYRLHVFPITTPPLRQRKEDIPLLVEHFAQKYSKIMGKKISTISKSSIKRLHNYPWPGNVRELENIIERAVITSTGKTLKLSELYSSRKSGEYPQDPSHKKLKDVERAHILQTLKQTGWRIEGVSGAASILGLNPSTLRSRMKKMSIQRQSYD
jgi:transcriptional regulator with GAF, ATPase, and Fis domain